MTPNEQPPDSLVGNLIDRKYRVDRCIGRGGMGAVYEATHVAIGKRVALKFLEASGISDRDAVVRFQREAEAASAVESAHIVQIFDSGTTEDDRPYLVMELLRGEDLRARIKRLGRLPEAEVVHIAVQTLRGLLRAHEAGIIHRDLKPDNLFLNDRDDDPLFVKIVDFGISKVSQTRATANTLTRRGTVLGTAYYMSPEQAQAFADIDGRADLYSLGAILFEALTGQAPHDAGTYEAILVRACTTDAPNVRSLTPEVSEAFARVVAKALCRDRAERYQSAREFLDAVVEAAPDLVHSGRLVLSSLRPSESHPSTPGAVTAGGTAVHTLASERRGGRRTLVAALIAALGAFALTVLLMARSSQDATEPRAVAGAATGAQVPAAPPPVVEPVTQASATPSASAHEPAGAAPSASAPKPTPGRASNPKPRNTASPQAKPAATGVAPNLGLNPQEP